MGGPSLVFMGYQVLNSGIELTQAYIFFEILASGGLKQAGAWAKTSARYTTNECLFQKQKETSMQLD